MNPAARDEYLSTEVLTASPQKLQLMLIDSAIRAVSRGSNPYGPASGPNRLPARLSAARRLVAQLIAGLVPNHESPLVQRVLAVYEFVHRTLVTAQRQRDPGRLADVLAVLEIERETWRQVCEQLDLRVDSGESYMRGPHADSTSGSLDSQGEFTTGISFEA